MGAETAERTLLQEAELVIHKFCVSHLHAWQEARLQLLEAAAARFGGFDLSDFRQAFALKPLGKESLLSVAADELAGLPPFGGPGLKLVHRRSCDDGGASGRR